jgi:hypothetical protein
LIAFFTCGRLMVMSCTAPIWLTLTSSFIRLSSLFRTLHPAGHGQACGGVWIELAVATPAITGVLKVGFHILVIMSVPAATGGHQVGLVALTLTAEGIAVLWKLAIATTTFLKSLAAMPSVCLVESRTVMALVRHWRCQARRRVLQDFQARCGSVEGAIPGHYPVLRHVPHGNAKSLKH